MRGTILSAKVIAQEKGEKKTEIGEVQKSPQNENTLWNKPVSVPEAVSLSRD
jgi:hypothetical protein